MAIEDDTQVCWCANIHGIVCDSLQLFQIPVGQLQARTSIKISSYLFFFASSFWSFQKNMQGDVDVGDDCCSFPYSL